MKRNLSLLVAVFGAAAAVWFLSRPTASPDARPTRAPQAPAVAESSVAPVQDDVMDARARMAAAGPRTGTTPPSEHRLGGRAPGYRAPESKEAEILAAWEKERRAERLALREKDGVFSNNDGARIVSFHPDHVQVAGASGFVRYAFTSMSQDGRALAEGSSSQARVDGSSVTYARGSVEERYLVLDEGIEQLFVIPSLPGQGNLVIAGSLESNLTAVPTPEGVSFRLQGAEMAYYKEAFAIDAAGRKTSLPIDYADGKVTLTVPADWLVQAAFPITIDPLIGTNFTIDSAIIDTYFRIQDVVWNSTNSEYVVVWNEAFTTDSNGLPKDFDVLVKRYTASGTAIGSYFYADSSSTTDAAAPQASYASAGNKILVVWQEKDSSTANWQIRGRVLNGGSTTFGTEFTINPATSGVDHLSADVAFDGTNWLVVYEKKQTSGTYTDIVGRQVSTSGSLVGSAINVIADSWDSVNPSVSFGGGQFLVVWSDHSTTDNPGVIWGKTVSPSGTLGSLHSYSQSGDNLDRDWPEVAAGSSEFLVVWHENSTKYDVASTTGNVYARRASTTGSALTSAFAIQSDTADQHLPTVAWNSAKDQYLVVWGEGSILISNNTTVVQGARVQGGSDTILENNIALASAPGWSPRACSHGTNTEAFVAYLLNGATNYNFQLKGQRFDFNNTPAVPTSLTQHDYSTGASQPVGFVDTDGTQTFKGTLTDSDGDQVQLQVEIKPVANAFDGTGLKTGTLVSSGSLATVTASGQTQGNYHWRARAVDAFGTTSAWVSFGGNAESSMDFGVDLAEAPAVPTTLGQFKQDGATALSAGATTNESTVVFKGTVSDPDASNTVKLEVEVKALTASFDGTNLLSGNLVASGNVSTVTATALTQTSYHWRARSKDSTGLTSAWVEFGTTGADFVVDTDDTPDLPANLGQFKSDGTTAIAVGATTLETTVVFKGTVSDSEPNNTVKLQIELKPTSASFDGTSLSESALVANGSVATVTIANLAPATYHWRARAVDNTGLAGAWQSFGGNSESETDVKVFLNTIPDVPTGLGQFLSDGTTAIAVGATTTESAVVFKGTPTDPDGGPVTLQVEVKPVGTPFDGTVSGQGVYAPPSASITLTTLANNTSYHWQARSMDEYGATSAWVSFGSNNDPSDVDFAMDANDAPNAPTALGQFKADGTTAIPVGTSTNEISVVFKGTVSDLDSSNTVKLEVEVKAATAAFDGNGTTTSTAVANGSVAQVTVGGLTNGSYHWRARAVDNVGAAGAWTNYSSGTDFTVDTTNTTPPTFTAGPTQHDTTTSTAAGAGLVSQDDTVVFKATLTDADGQIVKLELEVKANGTAFSGTATHTSSQVASGTAVTVTASGLASGQYHWQYRAADSGGQATAWTAFDTTDPDFTVNGAPSTPTGLAQFKSDGTTALAIGATTDESTVVFKGTVSDADGDNVQLEVEVKPVGTNFNSTGTTLGAAVSSGSTATTTVTGLANTSFHWRARTADANGGKSAWKWYGNNLESEADFKVYVNTPPATPTALGQFKSDGTTSVPVGGTTNETSIVVKGTVSDTDAGQTLKLQVELKPVGTAFDETNLTESASGSNNSTASVTVTVSVNGAYHWRARTIDNLGATSAWVSFGGNSESDADVTFAPPLANTTPNAPSGLGQFKADGFSPIASGATTNENVVVFKGTATDPDGDNVKLNVEVQPVGTAFTGTASGQSGFVASGAEATLLLSGLADGSYHWQAWTVDSAGAASSKVSYGSATDFVVSTVGNTAPTGTASLGQFKLNGSTALALGATTTESGVALKGQALDGDAGQSVKLQVEVKPVGTAFDGVPTAESGFVASGATASVTVSGLADGNYRWQARAADSAGAFSAWVAFSATEPHFVVSTAGNVPPADPTTLGQFKSDGATALAAGASTNESTVLFKATVNDSDSSTVKLQVEVKPVGTAFSGTPSGESALTASGGVATATLSGLSDGSYRWQARSVDANGAASGWVAFGTGSADFSVSALSNVPPQAPTSLAQARTDGASVSVGGSTNESLIVLKGTVADPDAGGLLKLQVEVRPLGTAFTGTPTATSEPVANGATASLSHGGLTDGVGYHWQARTIDSNGVTSGWTSFGANAESAADFVKTINTPPTLPSALAQLLADGTPIAVGAVVSDTSVKFQGTVTDPDGDVVRLQVELRPVGTALTDGPMGTSSAVASGTSASVLLGNLTAATSYRWQARAIDSSGAASAWISYGDNPETAADFATPAEAVVKADVAGSDGSGGSSCFGSVASAGTSWTWLAALAALLALLAIRRKS